MDYVTYIRNMVGKKKIIMNAAACIVTNEFNQILLQKRGDNGFFSLPGGIMEIGESYEETAIREVLEETGYQVELLQYLGNFYEKNQVWSSGDEAHIICAIFHAKIIGGSEFLDGVETLELGFFDYDKLPPIIAKDHLEAIHQYFSS